MQTQKKTTTDSTLIDSHCHLVDEPLFSKLPEIIQAAFACGVRQFVVPCSRPQDFERLAALLMQYSCVHPAFGIHPYYVADMDLSEALPALESLLQRHPQALVGEIGLDFGHKTPSDADKNLQVAFFEAQLRLAKQYQRPVILHHRASLEAMLQSVRATHFTQAGFLHAYAGSIEQARPWLQLGFKLGLGSVLLKPNARKIYQLLPHLQTDEFVLETDAPYMVSSTLAQDYNEPKFVRTIAEKLAEFYQCDWQHIAQLSSDNVASVLSKQNVERQKP